MAKYSIRSSHQVNASQLRTARNRHSSPLEINDTNTDTPCYKAFPRTRRQNQFFLIVSSSTISSCTIFAFSLL